MSFDHNYQARLAMAEQIGEARAKIGYAIVCLTHCQVTDNATVQQVVKDLKALEASLMELRCEPQWTPEELEARCLVIVDRLKSEQQEKAE